MKASGGVPGRGLGGSREHDILEKAKHSVITGERHKFTGGVSADNGRGHVQVDLWMAC